MASNIVSNRKASATTLVPKAPAATTIPVRYLVVGGGGSSTIYAGGGAGGVLDATANFTLGGTYAITVGAGGTRPTGASVLTAPGSASSIIGDQKIIVPGGGCGGYPGSNGASSGGCAYASGPSYNIPGLGYAGSNSNGPGGGGGAGGAGGAGATNGGVGGIGLVSDILGTSYYFGGGGGGAPNGASGGNGGLGGGGGGSGASGFSGGTGGGSALNAGATAGASATARGGNGGANTGGAGGAGQNDAAGYGGTGGSGIVVIRYLDTFSAATTTGSPTVTVSGGFRIYKFTSSGTITF